MEKTRNLARARALLALVVLGACGPLPTAPSEDAEVEVEQVFAPLLSSSCPSCNEDELEDLDRSAGDMSTSGCQYATALGALYDEFMEDGMIDISDYYDYGGDHGSFGRPHGSIGIDVTIGYNVLNNEDIEQSWVTHTLAEELMHHFWHGQCPTSGWNEDCHEEGPLGGPGINEIANSCGGTTPDWPKELLDE